MSHGFVASMNEDTADNSINLSINQSITLNHCANWHHHVSMLNVAKCREFQTHITTAMCKSEQGALLWLNMTVTHIEEDSWCAAAGLCWVLSRTNQASELLQKGLRLGGLCQRKFICSLIPVSGCLSANIAKDKAVICNGGTCLFCKTVR